MAEIVYVLCALTSIACAALLIRMYRRHRQRLLLWSCLCFVGLAINNILLFVDAVMLPQIDLSIYRQLPALAGVALLIYGFIMNSD